MNSPKKQLLIILAIVFFGFLGLSIPYLIFPSLFLNPEFAIVPADWNASYRGIFLGITLATYPIGQFFGSPIIGALSDDYGRKKVMSLTLFIAGVCSLLSALALVWKSLPLLLLSRFIAGLMEGNLAIARAMAADIKELNKQDTFGKINAVASSAYLFGPMIGGVLADHSLYEGFNLSTPFILISFLFLSAALFTKYMMKERPKSTPRIKRTFSERINFIARLKRIFKNKQLKSFLILATLTTLAIDMFFEFGPAYLTEMWLYAPSELSLYNGFLALFLTIGSGYLTGKLAKRYPQKKILLFSINSLWILLMAVAFTYSHTIMFLLFGLLGLSIAVTATTVTVQISDNASDEIQGEVMGVQTSLRVLGDAIICLIGGVIFSFSPMITVLFAALFALLAFLYCTFYVTVNNN